MLAYLNGNWLPLSDAKISVLDRGFLFGDGIYEVVRVYQGKPYLLKEHLDRLFRSLEAIQIVGLSRTDIETLTAEILRRTGYQEATVYYQITRGAPEVRSHAYGNKAIQPTIFMYALPFEDKNRNLRQLGCQVVSYPDLRWGRCDIKSINLLGNVFAAQAAKEKGIFEALFVAADGYVTEGSHTNAFAVVDEVVRTMPLGHRILGGVTRAIILDCVKELGLKLEERPFALNDLKESAELFLTGTTTEVMPVIQVDQTAVGAGVVGPITRRIQEQFETHLPR